MVKTVKKYHYSVHLPNKRYDDTVVTNATNINGSAYVSTSHKNNPIIKFDINNDGGLSKKSVVVPGFNRTKMKFIGSIKDKLAIVTKYNWNICVLGDDEKNSRFVTIDSKIDLKNKIIEAILDKYPKSCRCEDCYSLIGFVQFHTFSIFVQLSCNHKPDHRLLYIVKANLNFATLDCTDLEVTNEYNYNMFFLENGLSEKQAKLSEFTGLCFNGDRVYLVSRYGNEGHLWEMEYFNNISYVGLPKFVAKLRRKPVGIYTFGQNIIVVCKNVVNRRMNYYLINN